MVHGYGRMRPSFSAWLWLSLAACGAGLKDGYFVKDEVKYRVAAPSEKQWEKVSFNDNDLAWVNRTGGQVLAMNATCKDTGDPSLEILTNHLLMGFTDRWLKSRETKTIDGREALLSHYDAKLDGVEVELQVAVLKKNGCVHDFSYVAPKGHFDEGEADFDRLLEGFSTGSVASR